MSTLIVGCGYLGRRVGRLLADRGETVLGTTRSAGRAGELPHWGVEPVIADVLDPSSLAALPDADRVLVCFGFDRAAGPPLRTVYVEGLRNVLSSPLGRAGRLVSISSTGVYGQNHGGWVDESSPAEPTHESGRVALEAEGLLRDPRQSALRSEPIVLRLAGLYGPGRIPRRAALERGEPMPGDPEKYLNLVHIDDAAAAAVAALDRGRPGQLYLVVDDRPIPRREYYALAARLLGAPEPRYVGASPVGRDEGREESNKRVRGSRLRDELGVVLRYPTIEQGLPAAILAS